MATRPGKSIMSGTALKYRKRDADNADDADNAERDKDRTYAVCPDIATDSTDWHEKSCLKRSNQ